MGRLLVTGAGGQLGRALARLVPDAVLLTRGALDVADRAAVTEAVRRHRPRVIVHAAAWTRVDAAEAEPEAARRVNVEGTWAVARAAEAVGALLVYPSTDYVFAGTNNRPYREEDPTGPLSVYGATKLEGEQAARRWEEHLVVRTSWVFGEERNFVSSILRAARECDELTVVCDQVALPTHSGDLARGILALIRAGARGTFHLAGGGAACSWAGLADAAVNAALSASVLRSRPRILRVSASEYAATRADRLALRPPYSVLDCSRAGALGIRLRPWRVALDEYVRGLGAATPLRTVERI